MKKRFIKFLYRIIKPYIEIEKYSSPMTMNIHFDLKIFGEKVSRIEITKERMIHYIV